MWRYTSVRLSNNLALKLKDRGFPKRDFEIIGTGEHTVITNPPNLEEIIEAIGTPLDLFSGRYEDENLWLTYQDNKRASGRTPIEAVANLWLLLNETG